MPTTLQKRVFTANPIATSSGVDNLADVNSILNILEMGVFRQAAILCDAMMRDDRIKAVLETRVGALRACPLLVKPANNKRKAARIARLLGGEDDLPGQWDRIFSPGALGDLSQWGTLLNLGVAEIIWTSSDGMWWPRLKPWHPQFVRWDWYSNRFKLTTPYDGEIDLPPIDEQPTSDGKWVVWCPKGYQYAWLKGLARAMAPKYVMRQWNIRDWGRYNEIHGQGLVKAIVPIEHASDDQGEDFFQAVANRGSEPTVKVPRGEDGNRFDVELVEAAAKTWDTFQAMKAAIDVDVAILTLGQNLTTEAGTNGGSHAAVKGADVIRIGILRDDASLAGCLRDQVLTWWARFNFGDPSLAPRPVFDTEPPSDELAEATALKTSGEAISALRIAAPDRIDVEAILEDRGIPHFTDEEIAAQAAVKAEEMASTGGAVDGIDLTPSAQGTIITVNEARRSVGLGPLQTDGGGPDPDGFISITDYQVKHAADIARAANAEAGEVGAPKQAGAQPVLPFGQKGAPPATAGDDPAAEPDPKKKAKPPFGKNARLSAALGFPMPALTRRTFAGMPVVIENPAGSTRLWKDAAANVIGATKMLHDYGYLEGVQGSDGEELDVYLGPDEGATDVHVVHQLATPNYKRRDEDKVMLGFPGASAAKGAYLAHRNDGDKAFESMSTIPLARFKAKLQRRTGSGKIHATARPDTVKAIKAMVATGHKHAAKLSGAAKRRYTDALTEKAISLGARTLSVDLTRMKVEIRNAESLPALLKRLTALYRDKMDPSDFARVVQKVRLMSQLAGAASVHKEAKA